MTISFYDATIKPMKKAIKNLRKVLHIGDKHAPACLRLKVSAYREFEIIKQRGGKQQIQVNLPASDDLPNQPQLWELPVSTQQAAIQTVAYP
jgi:hypothetical protein